MHIRDIQFVTSATRLDQMPDDGWPEVAFVGRSNVGKSALLNMLIQRRKLARISAKPGKTRTFNFYRVNEACYFVDIPGYGYARVSKSLRKQWMRQIEGYLRHREPLRMVLHLVDGRHQPGKLDQDAMQLLADCCIMRVTVLTKMDKLSGNARVQRIRQVSNLLESLGLSVPVVASSARTKLGRSDLLDWIGQAVNFP